MHNLSLQQKDITLITYYGNLRYWPWGKKFVIYDYINSQEEKVENNKLGINQDVEKSIANVKDLILRTSPIWMNNTSHTYRK